MKLRLHSEGKKGLRLGLPDLNGRWRCHRPVSNVLPGGCSRRGNTRGKGTGIRAEGYKEEGLCVGADLLDCIAVCGENPT